MANIFADMKIHCANPPMQWPWDRENGRWQGRHQHIRLELSSDEPPKPTRPPQSPTSIPTALPASPQPHKPPHNPTSLLITPQASP